jgi:hypothetical protein
MISKVALLILVFIAILLITINVIKSDQICPQQQIVYRYIPRTFEEEQEDPAYVSDIFKVMFSQQSPWVYSISNIDRAKQASIRDFFVNQY